jgi:hypothetical protein
MFLAVSTALMTLMGSATALAGYSPGGVHTPPTRVAGVVLKAPTAGLGLAFTGGETIVPLALIAAAMFALGAAALVVSRRLRSSTSR